MRRWSAAFLLLCGFALPARAHFVWIVPDKAAGGSDALVIFSDDQKPDANVPVTKIARTELFAVAPGGKLGDLKATEGKDAYRVPAPAKGPVVYGGVCRYGVVQKGKAEPFLLVYCAKALVGATLRESPESFWKPTGRLPLEIIPIEGKAMARVLYEGKPVADAEVVIVTPGRAAPVERRTAADGTFQLDRPAADGLCAIRARHVLARAGEEGGKKFNEVRYYATLTFSVTAPGGGARGEAGAGPAKADPEATRLLREARAARVNWQSFPGFTADLEYNHNGKVVRGRVAVSADGKVKVDLPDADAKAWAQRQLRSVVDHRLDNSAERNTPCAFVDENTQHPLGRAVRVLNDELHSSYRIRDRQIIEVNRQMKDSRFTITVLHNYVTTDKKYLPASYVVNTWGEGDKLASSTAFHQTWQRVGAFDLPETLLVVTTARAGATGARPAGSLPQTLDARSLRLSNHKLAK
jgi:uncharacterized GH25 family protein